ncbi:MAG TPA: MFS transporter [Burkholderiales bacterium]|nr:MFS transporter [Burkholderiales bacterium]
MSARELRASFGLAGIFGLRMLGMFIILPVFVLYARELPGGGNHTLVGIALGAYGLAQACLQVVFGWLSDRWGRKRTIYVGLAVFAVGSAVAGLAHDIYLVIAGRAIQGAGAVSSVVIALAADLTAEENRTKAMAIIGVTIGATFALSMVAGPALSHAIGVPGIFFMTGALALVALPVMRFVVPDPAPGLDSTRRGVPIRAVLHDPQLARLNLGIFTLHAILMALWVVVPLLLERFLSGSAHWKIYLPVMLLGVAIMAPIMIVSERTGAHKAAFVGAIAALALACLALAFAGASLARLFLCLTLFFAAFNLLEASLPSLVSKLAPAQAKGTAIGVYSTTQFIGSFAGASAGGWLFQHVGGAAVFAACTLAAFVWLIAASGMRLPRALVTRRYPLPRLDSVRAEGLSRQLAGLPGVREVLLSAEGVAYLKVDSAGFDEHNVIKLLANEN